MNADKPVGAGAPRDGAEHHLYSHRFRFRSVIISVYQRNLSRLAVKL